MMSVCITQLIWQAKPQGQTIPKNNNFQPSTVCNGFHVYYEAKYSQIAVPRASTRCQQKEFQAGFWKNELEDVVFLSGSHFG
jgi:hypothetical protein